MNRDAYFYLEMKEHELKVPYTGKNSILLFPLLLYKRIIPISVSLCL